MPPIAEALAQAFEKIGQNITEKMRSNEFTSQAQDLFRSQRTEFMRDGAFGKPVMEMLDEYDRQRSIYEKQLSNPVRQTYNAVKDTPFLGQKLSDLHQTIGAQHPAFRWTSQLMATPENHDKTLLQLHQQAYLDASEMARSKIFGDKSQNLTQYIYPLYESNDPRMHSRADAMLNIISNHTKDTLNIRGPDESLTKLNMKRATFLEAMNAGKSVDEAHELAERVTTNAVYKKDAGLNKLIARRTRIFLAPYIAIAHLGTALNLSWAPLTAIGKTLATLTDSQIRSQMEAAGIFNHLLNSSLAEDLINSTNKGNYWEAGIPGLAGRFTTPRVGRVLGRVLHNPGFNYLRKAQLYTGGILGYHSAMHWAEEALTGDKRAILELREMGLDVAQIQARGRAGQRLLEDEDLQKAIWHFTNNRMFISRALDRSLTGSSNPWMRMLTMFHGYVNSQQQFMRREFHKMLQAGDYTGLARLAGTLGLIFPAIAPLIKGLEVMAKTASVQQAQGSLQQDYQTLTHPDSAGKWLEEYLDLMSYFGTWGSLHSYITAAHNDRLALQLMGPIIGSGTRDAQDMINFTFYPNKVGYHNPRPITRDIMQWIAPGVSGALTDRIVPPKRPRRKE